MAKPDTPITRHQPTTATMQCTPAYAHQPTTAAKLGTLARHRKPMTAVVQGQPVRRRRAAVFVLAGALLFAHSAWAFTDGSGYQILIAVQSSLSELKKQLDEIKRARRHLETLNGLSLEDASDIVRGKADRYLPSSHDTFDGGQNNGGVDGDPFDVASDSAATAANELENAIGQIRALEQTPKRQRLLKLADDRLRYIRQKQLVDNYSLSDRQARDVQTELLLEIVTIERERAEQNMNARERARRYHEGLTRFLY